MGSRRIKLMIRWSILTAAVIVLFWTIYYLIVGKVPVVTSIGITGIWTYVLPFGISRWWDVLIGPIWSVVIILLTAVGELELIENLLFLVLFGLGQLAAH